MKNILVIDDDQLIGESLTALFSSRFNVIYTDAAEKAQIILKGKNISLIILDIYLNNENGLLFLKYMKKFNPFIPVYIISGYGEKDSINYAYKNSAKEFIGKPFNSRDLYNKIITELGTAPGDQSDELNELIENGKIMNLNVTRFSNYSDINTTTLFKQFKLRFGTPPYRKFLDKRMEKLAYLLKNTNLPFGRIAEIAGYKSTPSALRIFKKTFKITPLKYRKTVK